MPVGLSECVGPYILAEFPDLLEAFDDTLAIPGMTLQGHLPDMYGPAMSACVAARCLHRPRILLR